VKVMATATDKDKEVKDEELPQTVLDELSSGKGDDDE
jgi:hypothetical protein